MVPIWTPAILELGFPRFFMIAGAPKDREGAATIPANAVAVAPRKYRLDISVGLSLLSFIEMKVINWSNLQIKRKFPLNCPLYGRFRVFGAKKWENNVWKNPHFAEKVHNMLRRSK